jgi:hypothetical protein
MPEHRIAANVTAIAEKSVDIAQIGESEPSRLRHAFPRLLVTLCSERLISRSHPVEAAVREV